MTGYMDQSLLKQTIYMLCAIAKPFTVLLMASCLLPGYFTSAANTPFPSVFQRS